jgi:hypothetical protein
MGAAGVGVIPTFKFQLAQFADPDSSGSGQFEDEYVYAFGQTKNIRGVSG